LPNWQSSDGDYFQNAKNIVKDAGNMDQTPPQNEQPQQPLYAQVVREPIVVQSPRKSGLFARLFMAFLIFGLFGSLALNLLLFVAVGLVGLASADDEGRVKEKYFALNHSGKDKVAIISIEGTILSGEGFFKQQVDHARKDIEDGNLKAIVLRVNSPGGTISGSDYMFHHLRKLTQDAKNAKVPIVVSMGGVAASGGYYVSMCVGDTPDSIFAEPSTWTGSIGVIIPHYNVAELMEKWGIQEDAVASHRLKGMGSITRKMTSEERQILQQLVDDGFTQFKNVIKQGRPKFRQNPAALDKLATGQVYTADQALKSGLIDKIGYIEEAIDRAIALANLSKADVKVVKYKAEPLLSEVLFGQNTGRASLDLAAVLESTTPRAYYLCTWLPGLAGSEKQR
jgi:protease IV